MKTSVKLDVARLSMIVGDMHATARLLALRGKWADRIEPFDIDGTLEYPELSRFYVEENDQ